MNPEQKRQEIDWGLRNLIKKWTNEESSPYLSTFSRALRQFLHSQGVVIKVEGELPDTPREVVFYSGDYGYKKSQRDMLNAGYTRTISLIEEK